MMARKSYHTPLDEKGIALVTVLILSAVALTITAGLFYMILSETQISGLQKRYKTALEAGVGGSEFVYQFIGKRGNPNIPSITLNFGSSFSSGCMAAKLNSETSSTNWVSCGDYVKATSTAIIPGDATTYDMNFTLGTGTPYTVYAKIIDTVEGNSGGDEGLQKGGVVNSNSGEITTMSIPYLYTIELDAENPANPAERAKLSVLYEY